MPEFVCPRCGDLGYLYKTSRGDHIYYYTRHITVENKRRKERKCYLGAEQYEYVEMLNPMRLSGAVDEERFRRYLEHLIPRLSVEDLRKLKTAIDKELERLDRGRAVAANAHPQD